MFIIRILIGLFWFVVLAMGLGAANGVARGEPSGLIILAVAVALWNRRWIINALSQGRS